MNSTTKLSFYGKVILTIKMSDRGYYVFKCGLYYIFYDCHLQWFNDDIVKEAENLDYQIARDLVSTIDENYDYGECERAGFNGLLAALENPMQHDLINVGDRLPELDDYINCMYLIDLDEETFCVYQQ